MYNLIKAKSFVYQETWIKHAKNLPLGKTARINCCNHKATAIIENCGHYLRLFCYRCKTSAKHKVQFCNLAVSVESKRQLKIPEDSVDINELDRTTWLYVQNFFLTKGLTDRMFNSDMILFSPKTCRLIFHLKDNFNIGRTLNNSVPKWVVYGTPCLIEFNSKSPFIVFVEDYLSAVKLRYITELYNFKHRVIPLFGTNLKDATFLAAANAEAVLIFLDGDAAGRAASHKITKRLTPFVKVMNHKTIDGLDPKDYSCFELSRVLTTFNEFILHEKGYFE